MSSLVSTSFYVLSLPRETSKSCRWKESADYFKPPVRPRSNDQTFCQGNSRMADATCSIMRQEGAEPIIASQSISRATCLKGALMTAASSALCLSPAASSRAAEEEKARAAAGAEVGTEAGAAVDAKADAKVKAKARAITNLEEAREAGERRRDERARAQGPIVTLPSGIRYRELEPGTGREVTGGDAVQIYYTLFTLNGFYVDSVGYGKEGKNDVGETFNFIFGSSKVARGVQMGMEGMRVGGRRRIQVGPALGWVDAEVEPLPTTGAGVRRLARTLKQAVLFEVELVKCREPGG
eukprot:jgi/Mesen1/9513/ME000637S08961